MKGIDLSAQNGDERQIPSSRRYRGGLDVIVVDIDVTARGSCEVNLWQGCKGLQTSPNHAVISATHDMKTTHCLGHQL